MAIPLGKLTIIIGAGVVGSILTKEGRISDVTSFFSGALKIVTKHLQHDKDNSRSTSKPQTDSLLAQVNNLRQELQLLASSRSVTIVTGSRSASGTFGVTTVIVVGFVGYGYIWWKGWKLSDMMFVTRSRFSDACTGVGKQLELVSSSLKSARRHLSTRIDRVDCNLDECKELTAATKDEVSKLHGELSGFHVEVESVHRAVQTLETKLGKIEGSQEFAARGIYHLCDFVQSFEQSRKTESIEASPLSSQRAIELPENAPVMMGSVSPLALEPPSPSASIETPKVLRPTMSVSASGLKELQEISNALKTGNPRTSPKEASNGISSSIEASSSTSSSSRFGWRLPGISILSRANSTAN